MSNKENDNLDELLDELDDDDDDDDDELDDRPKYSFERNWTTFRIRKSSRDILTAMGQLPNMLINRGGYLEPRPMNQVLEYLLVQAGKRLLHRDMGPTFEHEPSPFCACGPSWPKDTKYVVSNHQDKPDKP